MVLGIPYPEAPAAGVWGPPGSHMNFCEEDYILTKYIAEFFNTLTSLVYIAYGIHGIRRVQRKGESLFSIVNLPLTIGLVAIGLGSSIYHATLQYHTQMADEMSMHFAMGCVLIRVYTFRRPPATQRRNAAIIVVGLTSFIIYHCVTDEFTLHVILFFALSLLATWRTRTLISERITDPAQKRRLATLATSGSVTALFAYFLWNIDVHLCSHVTKVKRQLGLPFSILLELHGWWHVLTAIAAYIFISMIEFLTSTEDEQTPGDGFFWPVKSVLQDVIPQKHADMSHSNGHAIANGSTKKRT